MPRKSLVLVSMIVAVSFIVGLALSSWAAPASTSASGSASPAAPATTSQRQKVKDGAEQRSPHLREAAARFERGFYELLPKNRRAEAAVEFDAAVREYELALAAEPLNREAHRGLARVFYIQKDYALAAEHYRRLTEIDPFDIDSYALAAVALAEAGRFPEARSELEKAKLRTADPHAITMLDGFLEKLAEAEKQPAQSGQTAVTGPAGSVGKEDLGKRGGAGDEAAPQKRGAEDPPSPVDGGR